MIPQSSLRSITDSFYTGQSLRLKSSEVRRLVREPTLRGKQSLETVSFLEASVQHDGVLPSTTLDIDAFRHDAGDHRSHGPVGQPDHGRVGQGRVGVEPTVTYFERQLQQTSQSCQTIRSANKTS